MPSLDPITLATLIGGLIVLGISGHFLVDGALSLAKRLGVSGLAAGIFIVGFGTSAPELLVALDAARSGYPDLALGNIVGSNIANIWLVLALPALLLPQMTGGHGQRTALIGMLLVTAAWIALTPFISLTPAIGYGMLAGLAAYAIWTYVNARQGVAAELVDSETLTQKSPKTIWTSIIFVLVGIAGLPLGAHLMVEGGVSLAEAYNVPDEYIGLTLLAVGTSLPELGAGIAAALRKKPGVFVGNVIGSNIFNILGAGGIISIFGKGPISVTGSFTQYDHWAMAAAALTAAAFILTRARIGRLAALLMLAIYAVYITGLVNGWSFLDLVHEI